VGIGGTGFLVLPRLGKQNTTKLGCLGAAAASIMITSAGFAQSAGLLKMSLLVFGLSSGILTAGATSLMLDLTAAETAGTFIGAWGLAQAMARGLSTVLGGGVLNLGKVLFGTPVMAYGLVFVLQAIGLIAAISLLQRVSIKEFKDNAQQAILEVIGGDLEG
jgi:BCD family chlorophyll transporter-like MFS transporter